jgi:hypothetical protein
MSDLACMGMGPQGPPNQLRSCNLHLTIAIVKSAELRQLQATSAATTTTTTTASILGCHPRPILEFFMNKITIPGIVKPRKILSL